MAAAAPAENSSRINTRGGAVSSFPRLLAPSWTASVVVHGLLLFVFATTLRSCGPAGPPGPSGAEFREVGIFVKADDTLEAVENAEQESTAAAEAVAAPAAEALPTTEPFQISDVPPVAPVLPQTALPTIGLGAATPSPRIPGGVGEVLPGRQTRQPTGRGGLEPGEVGFFEIRDKATRVVFVIDCSASMANYGAIRVAKAELIASLQGLDRTQQFQIIFYNQTPHVMALNGERQPPLYFGREPFLGQARQYIASMPADLGTDHLPAIKKALSLGPEVIFLLTDADEPQLTAADLNQIDRANQGRCHIHCVEFGRGAQLNVDNFLKRLARQNGGTHRYRDVTQFER
jgi:Ca-activated chloride channel family protein